MRPARPRSVCLTQPHTCTYELSEFHDLWPFILPKVRLEFQILQAPMGKQVFFYSFFFFFKPGSKAFYNCSPAFNAATWRETSFKSLSVSYGFCLFVFLSRSVSETNRSDDRLFSWGLPKGKKRKHWGMSQGWLKCYRCYLAHVIRGKGVSADIASVSQWTPFIPESQLMLLDGGRTACLQSASGNREKPPDIPNSDEGSPNDQVTEVTVRSTNVRKFLRMYFWSKWNKCTYLLLI